MAININLPKLQSNAATAAAEARGQFVSTTLALNHATNSPAPHQNSLVDNFFGFKPHNFVPTDIAINPINSH